MFYKRVIRNKQPAYAHIHTTKKINSLTLTSKRKFLMVKSTALEGGPEVNHVVTY